MGRRPPYSPPLSTRVFLEHLPFRGPQVHGRRQVHFRKGRLEADGTAWLGRGFCYENGQVPTCLGLLTCLGLPDCYDTPGMFWIDMDWFLQQYGLDCLDQVSYLQSGLCLAQTYSGPRVPVRSGLLWRSRLTLDLEILVYTRLYLMYKGQTLRPSIKGTDFGSETSLSTSSPNCNL